MGSLTLAYSPSALATAFRVGLISFFSAKLGPVWPKSAPGRAGAAPFPHLGRKLGTRGLLGPNLGLGRFCGTAGCGGQCREERKGRRIPLEGSGQDLRHLPGLSKGCKEAMRTSVLFSSHTICRRFYGSNHKMSKCTLSQFAPLHPCTLYSFLSQFHSLARRTDST